MLCSVKEYLVFMRNKANVSFVMQVDHPRHPSIDEGMLCVFSRILDFHKTQINSNCNPSTARVRYKNLLSALYTGGRCVGRVGMSRAMSGV